LVGINTAIFSQGGGNIGIGFSVPSNLARAIAERLLRDGKVSRGFFGARAESVDQDIARSAQLPAITGARLADVADGGPADKAGWKTGDVITSINGQAVVDRGAFRLILSLAAPGETVHCVGFHDGKAVEHAVKLGTETEAGQGEFEIDAIPGLRLKAVEKGLEVVRTDAKSSVAKKLKAGQIITALNGEKTLSEPAFESAIRKGVNTLTVLADGSEITVILRLE